MRSLEVGPPDQSPVKDHESEFAIGAFGPVTPPGTYDVYVSVGKLDGTPAIALPLANDDGQRRYKLGVITVTDSRP